MIVPDRARTTPDTVVTYPIEAHKKLAMQVATSESPFTSSPYFAASWLTSTSDALGLAAILKSVARTANAYNPWHKAFKRASDYHRGDSPNSYSVRTENVPERHFAKLVDVLLAIKLGKLSLARVNITGTPFDYEFDGTYSPTQKRQVVVSGFAFDNREIMHLFAATTGQRFNPLERRIIRHRLGQRLEEVGVPDLTKPPRMGILQRECPPAYISYR